MFPQWGERARRKEESALKAVENLLSLGDQNVKHTLPAGAGHCEKKDAQAWREPSKLPLHRRF